MIKLLIKYFLGGLALVLPFIALGYLMFILYSWCSEFLNIQSAGILIGPILIGLIAIGYARTVFGIKLFFTLEEYLVKTPILGPLYKALKDVTYAFVGAENKFSEPVLVLCAGEHYKIGFITNKENEYLKHSDKEDSELLFSVYFPLSFSLSGDLFLVPIDKIQPIDMKAKDVMQLIVSGGLIKAPH
ncbi:MAG: DUF502 domain-containing protein [Saprospiraceae bacterium]|nr:DUF502 domain-containing protein [Saprospiraceae bacterium]